MTSLSYAIRVAWTGALIVAVGLLVGWGWATALVLTVAALLTADRLFHPGP